MRAILVCPACRGPLLDSPADLPDGAAPEAFTCGACGLAYPIVDGVPWLVPEHARPTR